MHADYIAQKKCYASHLWLNIVEINNVIIQLKDIKSIFHTESKYASASIKTWLLSNLTSHSVSLEATH